MRGKKGILICIITVAFGIHSSSVQADLDSHSAVVLKDAAPKDNVSAKSSFSNGQKTPAFGVMLDKDDVASEMGIKIVGLLPGFPAEKMGLQSGDVLLQIDDQKIANRSQLAALMSEYKAGERVRLLIERNRESRTLMITLVEKLELLDRQSLQSEEKTISDQRAARIEDEFGAAELRKQNKQPWLTVLDQDGELVFAGAVVTKSDISKVPEPWRSRVGLLKRSYEQVQMNKE